jgi:hypothetical protein
MLKWVSSSGGPLIMMPRPALAAWLGNTASAANDFYSDYDRVCEVTGVGGFLQVGAYQAVIIGEDCSTTWVSDGGGGWVVGWVYAESNDEVLRVLKGLDHAVPVLVWEFMGTFTTPGACILFDSAEAGDDIRGDSLGIPLASGMYAIRSAFWDVDDSTRLLLHHFAPSSRDP